MHVVSRRVRMQDGHLLLLHADRAADRRTFLLAEGGSAVTAGLKVPPRQPWTKCMHSSISTFSRFPFFVALLHSRQDKQCQAFVPMQSRKFMLQFVCTPCPSSHGMRIVPIKTSDCAGVGRFQFKLYLMARTAGSRRHHVDK